jgi:hypothetical protein
MSLTITIPGAVEATIGATAPAVLTIGVGTPGATGPAGAPGQGVPVGGTAGQFLTKIDGTNFNTDWTTVNLSQYAVKANNLSDLASASAARTNLGLGTMATATAADYSTTAVANTLYAPIAAGQPTSGTVGQVLAKNSGTNYDSSWTTLIPGDRYLTSSTTSLTINNANKTLTVGTGLSYTSQQDVVIAYDASNHMHARVTTYNSSTGVMEVDVISHTGTGTFAVWTVNVGGTVPVASIVWGDITGTLGNQTDLATALNAKLELSGGVLDANATIEASTATQLAVFSGSGLNVELSANPSENSVLGYSGLQVQNFSGTMAVTPSGLTFPDASTQSTAGLSPATAASTYYLQTNPSGFITSASLSGYAQLSGATFTGEVSTPASTTSSAGLSILPGTAPTSPVNGDIWNTGSDLQVRLGGVTETIAEQSWVSTNYAPKADAALTGNVTITSNSANPALVITQDGAGDVVQFKDVTSDTTYSFINAVGKVTTIPAVTASAGFNIPHGTAPTTLADGDVWTTTGGMFARINGSSNQIMDLTTTQTVAGSKTFSNANLTLGSSTAAGTIAIGNGATVSGSTKVVNILTNGAAGSTSTMQIGPTAGASTIEIGPSTVGSNLYLAVGATASGSTKTVNIATGAVAGSTSNITIGSSSGGTSTTTLNGTTNFTGPITGAINNITLGNGTAASTFNLFTGATVSGSTKAVAIATGGAAGSTTTVTIGNTTGSTTTLQGTTNGVTAAADTNSVALATTAYVVGQAGSATPLVDGTAAVGTSLRYARQDHVHGTDTTRAPLASPSLTGTPLSTTAAADTNTTQIATTAFVVGQVSTTTPANNGTAAVGTSLKYARADHVHASDTTKANLASPTFTGTPTLPTGTIATTQTAGNNTTAVATTAFVTAAVPGFATTAEIASPSSTTKVVAPNDVVRMLVNRAYFDTQNSSPTFATSGAGATAYKMTNDRTIEIGTPNVGVAGYGQMIYDTTAGAWGALGAKRGDNFFTQDFSKKIWMSGTHCFTLLGDANATAYCMMGGRNTVTTGQPTILGFGWKLVGGGTALKLITYGYDGASLVITETASSFTPVANQTFDWMILNEGAGPGGASSTCKLYVNDVLVASGINSPGGATVNYNYFFQSFESTASMATRLSAVSFPVKVWWSKS